MTVQATETETKYEIPPGMVLPRLAELPGVADDREAGAEQLEAEYYDTGDLRLIRAGITLRRRGGGADAGWHLKLPEGGNSRRELRLPLGDGGQQVPGELAELVRVYARGEPLRPVARLSTRRQRLVLFDAAGESLAEVATDDVSAQTLGESTTISRWREVEVELTGGDQRLLDAADTTLRQAGLRRAPWSAKLERALVGRLPEPGGPPRLTPAAPAAQVVLEYLRQLTAQLKSLDPLVRRDEPDSVHQMRVVTRRLRSTLQTFGRVIPRGETEQLAGELKWLAGLLGGPRDAEVLAEHLQVRLAAIPAGQLTAPVQARLERHFGSERARARAELLAALESARYFSLLDELDQLIAQPPVYPGAERPAREVLPAQVRRAYKRTRRRMRRARCAPAGRATDVALHEARKAAKRARYAGEAVAPALGKKPRRFAKRMKRVQSVLGDHQDAVMARQAARELGTAAQLAGEDARPYHLLEERETQDAEELRARARGVWRRASRSRYRKWMR
jgi:CHAD domain-containing protein